MILMRSEDLTLLRSKTCSGTVGFLYNLYVSLLQPVGIQIMSHSIL